MPAPLGTTPTRKMPNIQVFGTMDSAATRAAVRFFRERRIVVRFIDLHGKAPAAAELRRFVDRLGAAALLDTEGRAYREAPTATLATGPGGLVAAILADVRLLRLPLVRHGDDMTAGTDEATWSSWLARPR